jgi:hypothetical protein
LLPRRIINGILRVISNSLSNQGEEEEFFHPFPHIYTTIYIPPFLAYTKPTLIPPFMRTLAWILDDRLDMHV